MTDSAPSLGEKPEESSPDEASFSEQSRDRVMSDVRYMLRQPSTPWIVFDRKPSSESASQAQHQEERPKTISSIPPMAIGGNSTAPPSFDLELPTGKLPVLHEPLARELVAPSAPLPFFTKMGAVVTALTILAGVAVYGTFRAAWSPSPASSETPADALRPPFVPTELDVPAPIPSAAPAPSSSTPARHGRPLRK